VHSYAKRREKKRKKERKNGLHRSTHTAWNGCVCLTYRKRDHFTDIARRSVFGVVTICILLAEMFHVLACIIHPLYYVKGKKAIPLQAWAGL